MENFLKWVAQTPLSVAMQDHAWMIPTIQAVHIGFVAIVFTSAMVMDLRVLGAIGRDQPVARLAHRFAPWVGWGVVVLLLTGLLLMVAEPPRAILNLFFQLKMAALAAAGALTWWLAADAVRRPDAWAEPARHPQFKLVAAVSIALWIAIVVAGRWIAYGP